jgi:hypothetical protein
MCVDEGVIVLVGEFLVGEVEAIVGLGEGTVLEEGLLAGLDAGLVVAHFEVAHGEIGVGLFVVGVVGLQVLGVELDGHGVVALLELLVAAVLEGS